MRFHFDLTFSGVISGIVIGCLIACPLWRMEILVGGGGVDLKFESLGSCHHVNALKTGCLMYFKHSGVRVISLRFFYRTPSIVSIAVILIYLAILDFIDGPLHRS